MPSLTPDTFFAHQLARSPLFAARYAAIDGAQRRTLTVAGRDYTLIYNPLRARSVTASAAAASTRPCFLCPRQRPAEQEQLTITIPSTRHSYHLAVNPFPILPYHFTIIAARHVRQTLTAARLSDMEALARQMPGYMLFFNGAAAGASAPDHFHFQAVRQRDVPLFAWRDAARATLFIQTCAAQRVKIDYEKTDMTNVLCWYDGAQTQWVVVARRCHRPREYYAAGQEQVLISPAALEYAGVVPLIRESDYARMSAAQLAAILRQCYDSEPLVDVGISVHHPLLTPHGATTTISGVRIGTSFHWEQTKTFTYEGRLLPARRGAQGSIINRLPAERYLLSVIASEMSATASMGLLKAQAVVARSWLVHLLTSAGTPPHEAFDVCGDDHCQRYQGLPLTAAARAEQAIAETRGEVLVYDGSVIDARYAKCCGGRTEEYQYCWDGVFHPYLTSVADVRGDGTVFCHTSDRAILEQVLNSYDLATTDFFSWQVVYTQAALSALVERKGRLGLGTITALEALARGRSGRISRMKIIGTRGTAIVGKELEIRRLLSTTHLYSSNFTVVTGRDKAGQLLFTLRGRGWGHGVGLCQIGAAVMGAEGYDYKAILEHYYKHTQLATIW